MQFYYPVFFTLRGFFYSDLIVHVTCFSFSLAIQSFIIHLSTWLRTTKKERKKRKVQEVQKSRYIQIHHDLQHQVKPVI